jgi:HSP20 family protein
MTIIRWNPYRGMLSLRDAMDRLFEESFVRSPLTWTEENLDIAVDMTETDGRIVVEADLPGLKSEDVDVSVTENTLTLKGEFKSDEEGERGNVHFRERRYGSFQRSIPLPTAIDADAAEAEFKDGVLKVILPKTEETRPKQIEVTAKS